MTNMINKRLTRKSCNREDFGKAMPIYKNGLIFNGYNKMLKLKQVSKHALTTTAIHFKITEKEKP